MFRSRITRMVAVALLGVSLGWTPAAAHHIYMERPDWMGTNPDDPTSARITPSLSAGEGNLPVAAALASPNVLPLTVSTIAPRIAIVSTGVDKSVFPVAVAARIETVGDTDTIGYGTYAASAVLQVAPQASISSFNVYKDDKLNQSYVSEYLKQIKNTTAVDASRYDAVLIAIPPSDLLDPVSAAMAGGGWDFLLQAAAQSQFDTPDGAVVGIPMDSGLLASRNLPHSVWLSTEAFRRVSAYWESIRSSLRYLESRVATVVPAGDFGDGIQRVLGLANLPEVVTVGGFNPAGMISTSTVSGPSTDLKIKPDLLAPTGIDAAMPLGSDLADYVTTKGGLEVSSATFTYETAADAAVLDPKRVKSRLDSTLTAASVVAARLGLLKKNGVSDPATQKAALYSATTPIYSVPSYRQGRGVLGGPGQTLSVPTAITSVMALISSTADLGLEPDSGAWQASLKVIQGTASSVTPTVNHFVGVDVLGRTTSTATSTAYAPALSTTLASSKATVTATPDDEEPGFYSGYISIPITAGGITTSLEVPLSLVKGFRPVVHSLYIHDLSVTDTAFSLAPALPPKGVFAERALAKIPLSPVDPTMDFAGTGSAECLRYYATETVSETCHGHGRFRPIPPGFYWARMWSDYSTPVTFDVTVSATSQARQPEPRGKISYTQFKTLLLPKARRFNSQQNAYEECVETYGPHDDWSGHNPDEGEDPAMWQNCTEVALDGAVKSLDPGSDLRYEGPNGAFLLDRPAAGLNPADAWGKPDEFRINMGYIRKAAAGNVSSRYLDIVASPCDELDFQTFTSPNPPTLQSLLSAGSSGIPAWSSECHGAESLVARRTDSDSSAGWVGLSRATYPFNLTVPNAFTNFNLNFAYEVANAAIVVAVNIGMEVGLGIVTARGVVQLPPKSVHDGINLAELATEGVGTGLANFEFNLLSENRPTGTVSFLFVPLKSYEVPGYSLLPAWAAIQDDPETGKALSFKVETTTPVNWPSVVFPGKGENLVPWERCGSVNFPTATPTDCGHTFSFDSNFSEWTTTTVSGSAQPTGQVRDGECRLLENPPEKADVCEDWSVFTHLPNAPTDGEYGYGVTETWASLRDVLDASSTTTANHTSVMQDLKDAGGAIYVPTSSASSAMANMTTAAVSLVFQGQPGTARPALEELGALVTTTSRYFEQLEFPMEFLEEHPHKIEVCINDGPTDWQDGVTATIDSICTGGFDSSGSWQEDHKQVPCIPRYPEHPILSEAESFCLTDPSSGQRTPVGPYVPYVTTSRLI